MSFRLGNVAGRAVLVEGEQWYDVERLSDGSLPFEPMEVVARTDELHDLDPGSAEPDGDVAGARLEAPVPRPRQVFALALNYREHAAEAGAEVPDVPLVFTKFPSCIAGPTVDLALSGERVDWEVELVVVVGRQAHKVAAEAAWDHVAALTGGQDFSDRDVQLHGAAPQFNLGKSFPGYGPIGPLAVSADLFEDPDDVGLSCSVNGRTVQDGRTSDLIFPISELVAYLSGICTLEPGDLIFTGTPPGVGLASATFLRAGDEVVSEFEGIGRLRNRCVPPPR